jgi:hypothetical protein
VVSSHGSIQTGGRGGGARLTTRSRAEPVSVLVGCGYPCSERGGRVAKTSGHLSLPLLTTSPPCGLPSLYTPVLNVLVV